METPRIEQRHAGSFVQLDASDGMLTRQSITLAAGAGILGAGVVLGADLSGGAATVLPLGTNAGNGILGVVTVNGAASIGTHTVTFIDATHFAAYSPEGAEIGHGTVGAPFGAAGLAFTVTAGAAPFAPADSFSVVVTGAIKHVMFDPTSTTGGGRVTGILFANAEATSGDRKAVAVTTGPITVKAAFLQWGPNVTTDDQRAAALRQLRRLRIVAI